MTRLNGSGHRIPISLSGRATELAVEVVDEGMYGRGYRQPGDSDYDAWMRYTKSVATYTGAALLEALQNAGVVITDEQVRSATQGLSLCIKQYRPSEAEE